MTPAQRRYRAMCRGATQTVIRATLPCGDFTAWGETAEAAAENLALLVAIHVRGLDVAQDVRERIAAAGVQMWEQ